MSVVTILSINRQISSIPCCYPFRRATTTTRINFTSCFNVFFLTFPSCTQLITNVSLLSENHKQIINSRVQRKRWDVKKTPSRLFQRRRFVPKTVGNHVPMILLTYGRKTIGMLELHREVSSSTESQEWINLNHSPKI